MTIAVDLGRKATKQTNKHGQIYLQTVYGLLPKLLFHFSYLAQILLLVCRL